MIPRNRPRHSSRRRASRTMESKAGRSFAGRSHLDRKTTFRPRSERKPRAMWRRTDPARIEAVHELITQATLHPLFTGLPLVALAAIGWAALRSRRRP